MNNDHQTWITILETPFGSAILAAGVFYLTSRLLARHLSDDAAASLSLWLQGDYIKHWGSSFRSLFDLIYGTQHFSLKCFVRSCIQSLIAVILIALVMPKLGIANSFGNFSLISVVLMCIILNFVPDYISLLQTRLLLKVISHSTPIPAIFILLFADLVSSGVIIGSYIAGFFIIFKGSLEYLYSPDTIRFVSIFFISSFSTSVFVWVYAVSVVTIRIFSQTDLKNILNIQSAPLQSIGLVFSGFAFLAIFLFSTLASEQDISTNLSQAFRAEFGGATSGIPNTKQLVAISSAYLFFIFFTHAAMTQSISSFLVEKEKLTIYKFQLWFSTVIALLLLVKLISPTILVELNKIEALSGASIIFKHYIVPTGFPKWQLATVISALLNMLITHLCEKFSITKDTNSEYDSKPPVVRSIRVLRILAAGLSSYTLCILLYTTLTVQWDLLPICENWFPWSNTDGGC